MKHLSLVLLVVFGVACTKKYNSIVGDGANSGQSVKEPTQRLGIGRASSAQCLAGGMVYTIYGDADENGSFGENDVLIDQQIVCSGINGADGANGTNGSNGADGANGVDGASMVFETIAASSEQCVNGGSLIMMAIDVDRSSSLTPADANHQAILVCNGANGRDGIDGQNGADGHDGVAALLPQFTAVAAIQACGNSVANKEVLLRLANGQVLGSFSDDKNGKMTRLAFLVDGTYTNHDNSGCVFSLSTSNDGRTRSISWFGRVQESWAISR